MKILRQIIRGCGTLPHVGEHPGTLLVLIMIANGAIAGAPKGWQGALFGAGVVAFFMVPMYLWGAYDRAKVSDQYEQEKSRKV